MSFGKYNKLYKYIWIYVIIRILNEYLFFGYTDKIKPSFFQSCTYPPNILIQIFFIYLGAFISSIIINYFHSPVKEKDKKAEAQTEPMIKYKFRYYVYNPNRYIISVFFFKYFFYYIN